MGDTLKMPPTAMEKHKCPRCGASLDSDGKRMWCTFVGGGSQKACSYGIDRPVIAAPEGCTACISSDDCRSAGICQAVEESCVTASTAPGADVVKLPTGRAKGRKFANDFWIVTTHGHHQHDTLDDAYVERARLRGLNPGKDYTILHCKRRLAKNEISSEIIARLSQEVADLKAKLAEARHG